MPFKNFHLKLDSFIETKINNFKNKLPENSKNNLEQIAKSVNDFSNVGLSLSVLGGSYLGGLHVFNKLKEKNNCFDIEDVTLEKIKRFKRNDRLLFSPIFIGVGIYVLNGIGGQNYEALSEAIMYWKFTGTTLGGIAGTLEATSNYFLNPEDKK